MEVLVQECFGSEWLSARACARQRCCRERSNGRVRIERVRFSSPASPVASLLLGRPRSAIFFDARGYGPS
ncbi:hypothetical protein NDU88_001372 [Pleurodeles waltl]|uniref:Uncharacterized protein n=1 Tax=Pleurodeles waltl TaxID=8319 RepID=A0AAV7P7R0_PLEWA|nr:hypothetical protein NDU88_001372 [Pleurodeles waltl]